MVEWDVYAGGVFLGMILAASELDAGRRVVREYADLYPDDTEFAVTPSGQGGPPR